MYTSSQQTRDPEEQSEPGSAQPTPASPRRGGRAVWALGGAVLATAVWGGLLLLSTDATDGPDVRYRMSDNLCADAEMAAVSVIYDRSDDSTHGEHRHRAMDVAECNDSLVAKEADDPVPRTLTMRLKLHKITDPRAEFEANGEAVETTTGPKIVKTPVEGLGERAYFGVIDYGSGAVVILMALDGGAEFSFNLTAGTGQTPEELKPLMIKDMRTLMANLAA
ncbi:hypothetical protein ACFYQA_39095 [Streptomyces sp. NPDC005774]|uniref:hypothetical protein n=1 Tax=Streptomyces sp. NPDC005774 TaxID=3364728 RepID=UPI0036930F1E